MPELFISVMFAEAYLLGIYCDNIFAKRSIPTMCFAHKGINPSTWGASLIAINKVNKCVTCKKGGNKKIGMLDPIIIS